MEIMDQVAGRRHISYHLAIVRRHPALLSPSFHQVRKYRFNVIQFNIYLIPT